MNIPGNKRVLLADLSTIDADVGTRLWVEGVGKYEAVPRDQAASNAVAGPADALTPISWQPEGIPARNADGSLFTTSPIRTIGTQLVTSQRSAKDLVISEILEAAPEAVGNIFLGEDVAGTTVTTSWPSSLFLGTAMTTSGAAGSFDIGTDARTGRKYASSSTAADRSFTLATGTYQAVIMVYATDEYTAVGGSEFFASITAGRYPLEVENGARLFNNAAGVGSPTHYVDGYACRALPLDSYPHVIEGEVSGTNATAGLYIGGYPSLPYSVKGRIYAVIPLVAKLTTQQRLDIVAALHKYYQTIRLRCLLTDGNSIAYGHPNTSPTNAQHAQRILGVMVSDTAVSSTTIQQAITRMATTWPTHGFSGTRDPWVFFYEICNSLAPSVGNQTDAQVLAQLQTYVAQARSYGVKVLMSTCMPASHVTAGAAETYRLSVNTTLRAQTYGASCVYGDDLIDWAAMTYLQNTADTRYFRDAIHPTDYLYNLMWAMIRSRPLLDIG